MAIFICLIFYVSCFRFYVRISLNMPPEQNPNRNIPKMDTFKVESIDPVFKSNLGQQKTTDSQNAPISAYGVLTGQKYTPSQPQNPAPAPIVKTSLTPKSIVRTYKGDLESAIEGNHLSSINIAIAENKKLHEQIIAEPTESAAPSNYTKNKIIVFASLIFIIAGIAGISLLYFLNNPSSSQTARVQELPSLITTEYKEELNLDTITINKFIGTLSFKLNEIKIPVNNLYNAFITTGTTTGKKLVTSQEVSTLLQFKMPDIVKRNLLPDFMIGTFAFGQNLPFIIFKTSYFENAYAGMLNWEKDMKEDFKILFRLSGYADKGGILDKLAPTISKKFEDSIIVNKDVRLLRGTDGKIMLIYGIIDKETIIITVSDTAFKELINRLNKEKGLKR